MVYRVSLQSCLYSCEDTHFFTVSDKFILDERHPKQTLSNTAMGPWNLIENTMRRRGLQSYVFSDVSVKFWWKKKHYMIHPDIFRANFSKYIAHKTVLFPSVTY